MLQSRSPGISCLGIIGVVVAWSSLPTIALAQIAPDNSLGSERSQVTRSPVQGAPAELIQGGARRGSNLFHSFSEFNVGDRQRVYFANPAGVQNILSRVTGNNPSNLLGTVGVTGNANLVLLNPNGILFGQNARLDIRGSFLTSTADSLQFDNGFLFSASNPQAPPLLTVNVPIGLQFGANPGGIHLQGVKQTDLRVGSGQTLALVGGDILLDGGGLAGSPPLRCPDPSCAPRVLEGGGFTAPGGRIELGSVAAGSMVTISARRNSAGTAQTNSGWELGYQGVQGFQDIRLNQAARVEANGGSIQVQGRRITLTDGSQIATITQGSQTGKNLTIRAAELLEVIGFDPTTRRPTRIVSGTAPGSTGNAGNLTIETQNLRVVNGAVISSGTSGAGTGGDLTVQAKSIEVIGINIIDLAQRQRLPSSIVNQAGQGSTGNAGNLTLETESLRVVDDASISVGTFAAGNGGNLTVRAKSIEIMGSNQQRGPSSTLVAQAFRGSTGNAGDITLITDRLYIQQGSVRAASVESGSAGNITIQANSQIILADNGRINASTIDGQGNITLTTPLLLMRRNSSITTNAAGNGTGGNITINAGFLVSAPNENNDIIANAFAGSGGQIRISAQGLFWFNLRSRQELQRLLNTSNPVDLDPRQLPTNDITAFSQANPTIDTGSITLQTPDLDPTQGLTVLPTDLTDPSQLIAATCPADQGSSFAITGRGGLPEDPRQPLIGQVIWQDDRGSGGGEENQAATEVSHHAIVEAQGWIVDRTGTVILVARQPHTQRLMGFEHPSCAMFKP